VLILTLVFNYAEVLKDTRRALSLKLYYSPKPFALTM
jgi:hypothetical protein